MTLNDKLRAIARPVSFAAGARLVRQGEASRGAFVISSGAVEAQVALPGGGTLAVAQFGEGDMFGEMALIERGVCSASVVAQKAVEAWFIGRDDFRSLVASRDRDALSEYQERAAANIGMLRFQPQSQPAAPGAFERLVRKLTGA